MYKDIFLCKNKVVLVTGGFGLMGSEVVRALSDFGAKVYSGDIKFNKKGQGKGEDSIKYLNLDICSESSVKRALKILKQKESRLDVLINCAYPKTEDWNNTLEKVSFASWKKNVNSHLGGYFLSCKLAAEMMKKQGSGSIINFASIYGIVAPDFRIYQNTGMTMPVAYSAIKGGIINLTKYFASYYGKYNIRVNSISPGGIQNNQRLEFIKKYSEKNILNKMGSPADVVGAAIYLSSDASRYVTGTNLIVDGGWTAY